MSTDVVSEAAWLVLYLREETSDTPEEIQAAVRERFPTATLGAVFGEVSRIQAGEGNA